MINWIYGFVLLLLFVLENIYFKIAKRYNILDVPNVRSSHHTITLRGGGVIFYLGVLVHGLIFDFFAPWFLCGVTLVDLMGVLLKLIISLTSMLIMGIVNAVMVGLAIVVNLCRNKN